MVFSIHWKPANKTTCSHNGAGSILEAVSLNHIGDILG